MTTSLVQLGALSLAIQTLPAVAVAIAAPVHHIIAIDISGSMYSDLPQLRIHLKNKLSSLVGVSDTVSLIWFSGRGQCGTLVEAMKIHGVADLSKLHTAIDRFLVATGLTGFKEPLQEAESIIDRLKAAGGNSLFNLFFMTDGYDNQWTEKDILTLCAALEKKLDSAAVIEFGWNCNRPLLTKMAETLGGKLVFSDNFEAYSVAFAGAMGGSTKKVPVKLTKPAIHGSVFAIAGDDILTFTPDATNTVLLPEGLKAVAYFTSAKGRVFDHKKHTDAHIFAALVPLAQRMDTEHVLSVLGALGDVALVNNFSSCFSKEDYSRFQVDALAAANEETKRYVEGFDATAVPKEDAYTVLELLSDLAGSEQNLFYPYHESFSYERIGAGTVTRNADVSFEVGNRDKGYPLDGLVWNEDRPNVSLRVKVDGKVTLPATRPACVPAEVESFIYRAYTVIRDGIVHTRKLPVSLNEATFTKLQANALLAGETWVAGKVYVLDYPKTPVINRKMVRGNTAAVTFDTVVNLAFLKGAQKVLNDYRDKLTPKVSAKFMVLYGQDGTDYLKGVGVTDYSGFNPPSDTVKSGDYYMAIELQIAAKGLSSLPKVVDVEAAVAAGKKLKLAEAVMAPTVQRIAAFKASTVYTTSAAPDALLATWIDGEAKAVVRQTRELMQGLAQGKFAIVVGHVWFSDLASLDDNTLNIDVDGFGPVAVTATLKDVQIEK